MVKEIVETEESMKARTKYRIETEASCFYGTGNKQKSTIPSSDRFYSPLVKSISKKENISMDELNTIRGSGKDGRVTKKDILQYIEDKKAGKITGPVIPEPSKGPAGVVIEKPTVNAGVGDEVFEMDRMRKLIADHMVMSKHTSPHVTMFHDVDMTRIVNWRNK